MSALFHDVHNTTTTDVNDVNDVNDVKLSDLVGTAARMLDVYQRHTSPDVDDTPDVR